MSNKVIKKINLAFVLLFLIGTSLFVIYPLMYVVSGAFAPGNSIATLSIIPFGDGITFKHFEELFTKTNYGKWFQNTLYVAVCTWCLCFLTFSIYNEKKYDDDNAYLTNLPFFRRDGSHLCYFTSHWWA